MFTSSHITIPNRYRHGQALRTFFPSSSFSPPDSKEPLRRGILFSSVATILMLVGIILTWLAGFNDVFSGRISMTGPLLITLSLLMSCLSCKQFMIARRRNREGTQAVPAVYVDQDDGSGAAAIVLETWSSVGVNNDLLRNSEVDLLPPAYSDVTGQMSYSSNCPSYASHDDRNEAPPTYEETFGRDVISLASENSSSAMTETSFTDHVSLAAPATQSPPPPSAWTSSDRSSPDTLTPGTPVSPPVYQATTPWGQTGDMLSPQTDGSLPVSASAHTVTGGNSACDLSAGLLAQSDHNTVVTTALPQCAAHSQVTCAPSTTRSRHSFSGIPSYTCLLSESGEVSSHIYDTSHIIQEMIQPQQSLSSPYEPSVNPHQPPVSPFQPPVSPLQPPSSPRQPPVNPQQHPVSPIQPPVSPLKPPISPLQPPISPCQPPVNPHQQPISPQQSSVSPHQSPVSPLQSPISPHQPSTSPQPLPEASPPPARSHSMSSLQRGVPYSTESGVEPLPPPAMSQASLVGTDTGASETDSHTTTQTKSNLGSFTAQGESRHFTPGASPTDLSLKDRNESTHFTFSQYDRADGLSWLGHPSANQKYPSTLSVTPEEPREGSRQLCTSQSTGRGKGASLRSADFQETI